MMRVLTVLVMVVSTLNYRRVQCAIRSDTGLKLHLYRRMFNLVMVVQVSVNAAQQAVMIPWRDNLHVQR